MCTPPFCGVRCKEVILFRLHCVSSAKGITKRSHNPLAKRSSWERGLDAEKCPCYHWFHFFWAVVYKRGGLLSSVLVILIVVVASSFPSPSCIQFASAPSQLMRSLVWSHRVKYLSCPGWQCEAANPSSWSVHPERPQLGKTYTACVAPCDLTSASKTSGVQKELDFWGVSCC